MKIPRHFLFSKIIIALLFAVVSINAFSETFQLGDLAPRGNPDGELNAADALILQRIILGEIVPTSNESLIGDVAPLGNPDGTLNAGDLVVQQRAILGLINLGNTSTTGPNAPVLVDNSGAGNINPLPITGSASPGINIDVYVNTILQSSTIADISTGDFSYQAVLQEGDNNIHAVAFDGVDESTDSNNIAYNFQYADGGTLSGNVDGMTLSDNTKYLVTSDISVSNGQTLAIGSGTKIEFQTGTSLTVYGDLSITAVGNQAIFTSSDANPTPGSWRGIVIINNSANVVIDNILVEWAVIGVWLKPGVSNVSISNSTIQDTSSWGVLIDDNADNVLIDNVLIEDAYGGVKVNRGSTNISITNSIIQNVSQEGILFDRADGTISNNAIDTTFNAISLRSSSPLITGNTLSNSYSGIWMYAQQSVVSPEIRSNTIISNTNGIVIRAGLQAANPIINSGNIITNNNIGVVLGDTSGVAGATANLQINNNEIHSNNTYNVQAGRNSNAIDMTNNWWGSTAVSDIAASINDNTDDATLRIIDYSDFLDAPNGNSVPGNYLPQIITGNITLTAGTPYQVLGDVHVASGDTLIIEAGAILKFGSAMDLIVEGTLQVNGMPSNPALFTSSNPSPSAGDWSGIKLNPLSINNIIDGAVVEYAVTGIEVKATSNDSLITNSVIRNNNISGISFNFAGGTASNNVISGHTINSSASGIRVEKASPLIDSNVIYNNKYGIYAFVNSNYVPTDVAPQIIGNNISNNATGIHASATTAQISGNVITSNVNNGISIHAGAPIINLGNIITNNYYGIYLLNDTTAVIDGNTIVANTFGIFLKGDSLDPQPVITNNDIYNNTNSNLYLRKIEGTTALNISNNWWGTDVIADIRATISGYSSNLNALVPLDTIASVANHSVLLPNNIVISQQYISPVTSPGIQDTVDLTAGISQSTNWMVDVRDSANQTVKTYSGTGAAINVSWDGKNTSAQDVIDGQYSYAISIGGNELNRTFFMVDNTLPIASITSPIAGQTLTSILPLDIMGVVADSSYQQFSIEAADGLAPVEADCQILYTEIATAGSQGALDARSLYGWVYNDMNGLQQLGDKTLRLTVLDKAGNVSVRTVSIALDYLAFTGMGLSANKIDPSLGETISVAFTINKPTTVKLKIYRELEYEGIGAVGNLGFGYVQGKVLINEIEVPFTSAGSKTIPWDGLDSFGNVVPQDFYRYEIEEVGNADNNHYYKIPAQIAYAGSAPVISSLYATNISFARNRYTRVAATIPANTTVRVISDYTFGETEPINKTVDEGDYIFLGDGRNIAGQNIDKLIYVSNTGINILQQNSEIIFVKNKAPELLGTEVSPGIEIKSDPYRIKHSYDQITNVAFTVSEDSYVTVDLLEPCPSSNTTCSTDPAVASILTVIDNQLLAASDNTPATIHNFEWRGYDFTLSSPDTNNITVDQEGLYTYLITATSSATGNVTTYRGSLYLLQ